MTLERGRRIGPYEVLSPLGAGGMGEVWRATDTRLERDVALKLLPAAFASDPDRLARFEREAKLLASLSHTHIAGLYAFEEATPEGASSPVRFLAMELAEGEDLAARLKRGALPVDEAIAIGRQVAEALEAAHEKGIVHRDLKPANVKVSAPGHVKVLDFGLAKAWSGDDADAPSSAGASLSPTLARTGTAAGLILGTAAYMSPEQARGKRVDKRADIWAFGVLLFEMLTGKPLFDGETVSDVLAAVLTREPRWDELPAATPPAVRRLLRRCLERNPRNRQHDIADVRVALDEAIAGKEEEGHATAAPAVRRPRWHAPLLAVAAALVGAAVSLWATRRPEPEPATAVRLSVALGADVSLATGGFGMGTVATLSPDGSLLAFVAQTAVGEASQLYVRPLASLEATPLSGTSGARNPFFSPDGRSIAFFADGKLKKIAVAGGAAVTICDAPDDRGGTWIENGTIVFAPLGRTGLQRVSAAGGTPEVLTTPDPAAEEVTHRWPHALPGGRAVLYTAHSVVGDFEDATIVAQPLPNGPRSVVQRGGYHGRYLASGHLAYVHEGRLFAAPFDPGRLALAGQPVPALEGVAAAPGFAGAHFAASDRGTLVYLSGPGWGGRRILWMDPEGKTEPLRSLPDAYLGLRFSPNGQKLAIDIQEGGQRDVWLYEWQRDTLSRLTAGPALDQSPIWTPDGKRITFGSDRASRAAWNLYWQRSDGAGDAERLTESPNPQSPWSWHPTGRFLAFGEQHPQTSIDVMILPMEGDESSGWRPGKPYAFQSTAALESSPAFSPDGRWLAYHSLDTGRADVFVRPFPGPGGKWQISTGGGRYPVWSRSGKEILYQVDDGSVWAASYTAEGNSFRATKPRMWSTGRLPLLMLPPSTVGGVTRAFDPHPDGRRLAVLWPKQEPTAAGHNHLVFIENFFDELRRIAPARR